MRPAFLSLGLATALFLPLKLAQGTGGEAPPKPGTGTGQEEAPPRPAGLPGYRLASRETIAKEIEGTWMLLEYTNPREVLARNQYSGFVSFQNGFFTILLRYRTLERGLLGDRPETTVQAGVHRYRISGGNALQTATVLGFSNESGDVEVEPGSFPREFDVDLQQDVLTLRRWDDVAFRFRRVDGTNTFPSKAADALERNRGRRFTPPANWDQKR